jgi:hypothetical protein
MNGYNEDRGPPQVPEAPPDAPQSAKPNAPAWRAYAHLYVPLIVAFLLSIFGPTIVGYLGSRNYGDYSVYLTIASAELTTYWLSSQIYPTDRADTAPEQNVRFTRKNDLYRAAVLFTYRWLYGTPFNLVFFVTDFLLSYPVGSLIGERSAGTKQRRSEFFTALLWVTGSWTLQQNAPASIQFYILFADRVLWRTMYIALVDDVVGVLSRPDVKTLKGKMILVFVQTFTITSVAWLLLSWQKQSMLARQRDIFGV